MKRSPVAIRIRRPRPRRLKYDLGTLALCPSCLEHFGRGYPLSGAHLAAVARYHGRHG